MAKFRFRLQSFLNLKEKVEDQRRMEYGKAMSALEEEKQKKALMEQERQERLNEFTEMVRDLIKPQTIAMYNVYLDIMKQRIAEQQIEVEKAEKVVEEKRVILVEAMKERKTLQTLKDRDYEAYVEEEKRAEQRIVDEIVSYKYADNGKKDEAKDEVKNEVKNEVENEVDDEVYI